MSNATTDRILSWLDSEIGHQERYHDHKERMAWTALAFYVPGVLILTNAVAPDLGFGGRVVGTILLGTLVAAVAMFVNMQFEMRWHAADLSNALRRVRGQVVGGVTLSAHELEVPDWKDGGRVWPRFLDEEVKLCSTDRSGESFDRAFRNFVDGQWSRIEMRMRSELASYVVLAVTTIVAAAVIWLPEFQSNSQ